ncbi:hypothetical protein EDC04DRAFT_2666788 [Pisolithus marmoratus]|nr:hypothetical protein EDC04DRAFT_2666788 [Pisolithus marmoratus]
MMHPSDILLWAMGETCAEIQNNAPYWAQQRRDHPFRYGAWSFCRGETTSEALAVSWRQPDAKIWKNRIRHRVLTIYPGDRSAVPGAWHFLIARFKYELRTGTRNCP